MKNNELNKIYKLVTIVLVIVSIDLAVNLLSKVNFNGGTKTSNEQSSEQTSSNYDVSMMDTLTVDQVVNLFNDKKSTYVVYFGRENCSACVAFLPTLQKMQKKYNYVTKYLDIRTVDAGSEAYKTLISKLSKEVTLTVNGEKKTDKFGSFFGYTPMVFVIYEGKFNDGFVGAYSEEKFETFLNNNGINSK